MKVLKLKYVEACPNIQQLEFQNETLQMSICY